MQEIFCLFLQNISSYFDNFILGKFHFNNCNMDNLNRLKAALADAGQTNKWLAEQLDCAPTTVSKWFTNACQPPMETYIKISKLLDVELTDHVRLE